MTDKSDAPARSPRQLAPALDEVDQRIIAELTQDGRLSVRTLAERLHVSRANAYSRLDRLVSTGVIRGFTITVDQELAGLTTSAYLTLQIEQNSWREVRDALRALPAVQHFALVGGDFDVILLARVVDAAGLRDLVLSQLRSIPGVRTTHTLLVFEES